jgi:hypothetical protein
VYVLDRHEMSQLRGDSAIFIFIYFLSPELAPAVPVHLLLRWGIGVRVMIDLLYASPRAAPPSDNTGTYAV